MAYNYNMYDSVTVYKPKKAKKAHKKGRRFKIFIAIILLIIVAIFLYYFYVVSPIICSLSEEKIRSLSTTAISKSVGYALQEGEYSYDDLVHISYNDQNEIELIQSDTVKINILVRRVTELVQAQMDQLGSEGIQIALGTFTGIPFLFGVGPMINLKLVPVGTVETTFSDMFESAGINQTKHTLNFNISANVGMILPSRTQNFVTSLQVAICESVILGRVPQVYLSANKTDL